MAYDEALAERVRESLLRHDGVTERKMFGGIAFMLRGHMLAGVLGSDLMARVGPHEYDAVLTRAGVRRMDFTGRPMHGYVYVAAKALKTPADLRRWLDTCAEFVLTLPKKGGRSPARRLAPGGASRRR